MYQRANAVIKGWNEQPNLAQPDTKEVAPSAQTRFPTIFHELLSTNLPASEKSAKRMGEEAFVIIAAGGETTGRTLTAATYFLLSDPEACAKLKAELKQAIPDEEKMPKLKELEQLPWLVSLPVDLSASKSIDECKFANTSCLRLPLLKRVCVSLH